ncbi:MAG: tyrosine-type recombinase/integrase [Candidatus Thiodiazotropha sp.]
MKVTVYILYLSCFHVFSVLGLEERILSKVQDAGISHDSFSYLASRMSNYMLKSRSDSTVSKYFYSFKRWEKFIVSKGGCALPANPIHVALYLTELLDSGNSDSVITSALYGIKWVHKTCDLQDPTDNTFVSNLVEAAKRIAVRSVKKKQPVTVDMLKSLCAKYSSSSDLLVIRDLCMILLSFCGFLRYDEISSLRCNDIQIFDSYLILKIKKSKTDQYRQGDEVPISKGSSIACPLRMVLRYLEVSKQSCTSNKYLFRPVFRSGHTCALIHKDKFLSYTRARECILGRLKEVAGDIDLGLHSMRAGGATEAANSGVNDRCWKRHGRWKSDRSKDGYVADSLECRLMVSKQLNL